ncbi:MAG: hypothetical protein AAF617_04610 [Bacteroidota bacterium]
MNTTDKKKQHKLLNRETLAELFKNGMRPSGDSFSNLIHSMVNKLDDGIEKNMNHGLGLSPQGNDAENLLSMFHQVDDTFAAWAVGLTPKDDGGGLNFKDGLTDKSCLYLNPDGKVGINSTTPQYTLDVHGTVGMKAKKGTYASGEVKADGKWHTVLSNETDCTIFELTACAKGEKGEGKYALLHAFALNPYVGKHGSIRRFQSFFGWKWWRRLQLRWTGTPFDYNLEIRTVSNYGENAVIYYDVMQLL